MAKKTSADWMKIQNTRNILKIIHEEDGIYRKLVAEKANLASQTVTNIVKELVDKKVLQEYEAKQKLKGRNPVSLKINYGGFYTYTIVITVQKLSVILHALDGTIVEKQEYDGLKGESLFRQMKESLFEMKHRYGEQLTICAIMVSVEGIVDEEKGIVVEARDIDWHKVDLKKEFLEFSLPVFVRNDVNLVAHYEKTQHKADINYMVIKLDRGIGSALVIDQHVLRSTNSVAGELGHITVMSTEKKMCSCGKYNCLTRLISKSALEEQYGDSYFALKSGVVNMKPEAVRLVESIADYLAGSLANAIILLDLDRIILTGGIIEDFSHIILPRLEQGIRANLSYWVAYKGLEVHKDVQETLVSSQVILDYYFCNTTEELFLWDNL